MSGIRKKRFWSEEEKRSICAQTYASGVTALDTYDQDGLAKLYNARKKPDAFP